MSLILGLIGEQLAGKDAVAEYLVGKYGAEHIRHSTILDEILRILNVPISRRNEIDLGMALRQPFGVGVIGNAVKKRVEESTAELIVINGIRFPHELENARSVGARIMYVTAPPEARFARFLKRQEKADDANLTLEEFNRRDAKEPTEEGIPAIGKLADIRIDNTGTLEALYQKVDEIMETLK